jgi:hypothetical protein
MHRLVFVGPASIAAALVAGCAPGPSAPVKSAQDRARESAEIEAEIARQQALDQISAKFEQNRQQQQAALAAETAGRQVKLGQSLELGGVQVTPERAEFRKLRWRELNEPDRPFEETGTLLVVTLKVKNISAGQTFKPVSRAKVTDNFGNPLKSPFPELSRPLVEGSDDTQPLPPGQEATVLLCVQPKNPKARSYEWEISTTASDSPSFAEATKRWQLTFNADELGR